VQNIQHVQGNPDRLIAMHERGVIGHDRRGQHTENHVDDRQRPEQRPVRQKRVSERTSAVRIISSHHHRRHRSSSVAQICREIRVGVRVNQVKP